MIDFETVRNVIATTLCGEEEEVTLAATLADDLGADSLASVELNMALEEATGISIPDEELPNLKTVGDIMNYLTAHQN